MVPVIVVLAQYDGFGIEPLQEAVGGRTTGTTFGGEEFHQDGCAGRIRRGSRQQQSGTGSEGQAAQHVKYTSWSSILPGQACFLGLENLRTAAFPAVCFAGTFIFARLGILWDA